MLLKNKKTGEIKELPDGFFCGDSLKKICEEWEDYEEPKGIQCIYYTNHFDAAKLEGVIVGFSSKEEAKKAVEKLKAWKRLKDKGFRFTGWEDLGAKLDMEDLMIFNREVIDADNVIGFRIDDYRDCIKDLDTCFGGEE